MKYPTVPELLEEVDYTYDKEYVPSPFALKMVNFIKLMTDGKGESSPTPVAHYKMLDLLPYKSSEIAFQYIANLAARGSSKTSLFSEILFFYIGVFGMIDNFGKVDAIIYVADTVENGVKGLKKNMQARWEGSEFLQKYIPDATFNQTEIYLKNLDGVWLGIHMFGANSGIRGTKIRAKRPQLLVLDDLLSDKNAKSDGIVESINDTLYKGANHALDPLQRKVIFNGTPFNEGDPLYEAIESGMWKSNVFPICEKFPCEPDELVGMWEERFDYEYISNQYRMLKGAGKLDSFYQELMLQINSDDERLITDADISWFNRADINKHLSNYSIYITTDFATSNAKSADDSAISVWAIGSNRTALWIDGILNQNTMDVNIEELFRLCAKYKPISVGIEINGQQAGFIPWIQKEMVARGVFFSLAKSLGANGKTTRVGILSPADKSKLERFNIMLPDIKAGRLFLPEDMREIYVIKEAVKQLKGVTKRGLTSRKDDWLDTYSMLGQMTVFGSSATPTKRNDKGGVVGAPKPQWGHAPNGFMDDAEDDYQSTYVV